MAVSVRRVLAAGACALALAGCGSTAVGTRSSQPAVPPLAGTEPNGEQLRTGPQLLADARTSLTQAASVQVSGTFAMQGVSTPVDLLSDRAGNASGSLGSTRGALQFQFDKAADAVFVRPTGNATGLVARLGLPPAVATPAAAGDSWALDAADAGTFELTVPLTLSALTATLLPPTLGAAPTITSGDVDGTPVVAAHVPGNGSVSVAVTGSVRLVRLAGGADAASLSVDIQSAVPPPLPTPAATPYP